MFSNIFEELHSDVFGSLIKNYTELTNSDITNLYPHENNLFSTRNKHPIIFSFKKNFVIKPNTTSTTNSVSDILVEKKCTICESMFSKFSKSCDVFLLG